MNENSKAVCFWNTFPELNHNETVGWEHPELTKEFYVVFLRDRNDQPKNQRRIDVTKELMAGRVAGMTDLWAEGESSLARLLSLVYPGDLASYYLALLYGVDPSPIQVIDRLMQELAAIDEYAGAVGTWAERGPAAAPDRPATLHEWVSRGKRWGVE